MGDFGQPDERTVDEISEAMSRVRRDAGDDAADVQHSVSTLLDWRYYVERHPWACAGAAAAVGMLIAPRAAKGLGLDMTKLASELKAQGIRTLDDDRPSPGFVSGLIGLAMPVVFRAGMSLAASYFQHRGSAANPAKLHDDPYPAGVEQEVL